MTKAKDSGAAVEAQGDGAIIAPVRSRYRIADLLQGVTPEAMRHAFDWGPDRGREAVEYG